MTAQNIVAEHLPKIRHLIEIERGKGKLGLNYQEMPDNSEAIEEIIRTLEADGYVMENLPLAHTIEYRWLRITFRYLYTPSTSLIAVSVP